MWTAEFAFFGMAAALYAAATALAWSYLYSRQERLSQWMFRLLALGVFLPMWDLGRAALSGGNR